MLDVTLKPVEMLLFRSDVVAMGAFRCPSRRPFRQAHVPVDSVTYLRQRRLFDGAETLHPFAVDEEAIAIAGGIIAARQRPASQWQCASASKR